MLRNVSFSMHVNIDSNYEDKNGAKLASQLIRKCVHCGFCNATCPTYQTLGDERSGPRGRISIIKDLLEGNPHQPILYITWINVYYAVTAKQPARVEFNIQRFMSMENHLWKILKKDHSGLD